MSDDRNPGSQDQTPSGLPAGSPPPPPPGLFPDTPRPASPTPPSPIAAPAPERPRRRRGLVIGLVIGVLLLLCAMGGCVALLVSATNGQTDNGIIQRAESHYGAAESALATASAAISKANLAADPSASVDNAVQALRAGRDEIAAARAAIEELDVSDGRTKYLDSLTSATEALGGLEDVVAYLDTTSNMLANVSEAGAAASNAVDLLNAAVKAGNSSKYGTMKQDAQAASKGFAEAARLFREAHKLDTSAGLDKAAAYADKREQQSDVVIRMAAEGKSGKTSAYNTDIGRMKALSKQADQIGEPAIVKDPNWVETRLTALGDSVSAAGLKADQLRAAALTALEYSK